VRRLLVLVSGVALVGAIGIGPVAAVAGGGDIKKFCKANLAVDQAPEAPSDKQLEKLRDAAPPEIADTVNTAVDQFQEQGEDAFEDPAFAAIIDNCGYEVFDVSMQDYAFDGMPSEIEKGTVAFNLTNDGAELHELALLRLKGDATLDDLLELPEDASEEELGELAAEVPGGGFAFPGDSDVALANFKKTGTYVAICFIPVGSTPDAAEEGGSGPPHFAEGMAAEFEVTS
jgi:hypothetical protein